MRAADVLLQGIFLAASAALLVAQVRKGWQLGFGRQFFNLLALAAAYAVAVCGGEMAVPIFRPTELPDFVIRLAVGFFLALIVFLGIREIGRILQRERIRWGNGKPRPKVANFGGAVGGGIFAIASIWITLIGVRLLGTIAETNMTQTATAAEGLNPASVPPGQTTQAVMSGLATLKRSLEAGPTGRIAQQADPLPASLYSSLRKLAQLLAQPERANLFLAYPGAQELVEHPRLVALQEDPEIAGDLAKKNYLGLLTNRRVVEAANDPDLREKLRGFQLEQALDFALEKPVPDLPPIGEQR